MDAVECVREVGDIRFGVPSLWSSLIVLGMLRRRCRLEKQSPPASSQVVALSTGSPRPASLYCTSNIQPAPNYPFPTHPASRTNARFVGRTWTRLLAGIIIVPLPTRYLIYDHVLHKAGKWPAGAFSIPVCRFYTIYPPFPHPSKGGTQ